MSAFDHTRLDEVIHSRIRLSIMAVLAGVEHAEFTFLKAQVNATDGNLSVHLRKLEEAGYIRGDKRFVARRPVTRYNLTASGRKAFSEYLGELDAMLNKRPPAK